MWSFIKTIMMWLTDREDDEDDMNVNFNYDDDDAEDDDMNSDSDDGEESVLDYGTDSSEVTNGIEAYICYLTNPSLRYILSLSIVSPCWSGTLWSLTPVL
jgi:hypothetical protein